MNMSQLAETAAKLLQEKQMVIFLGAGVSLGNADEQRDGLGVPASKEISRAIAEYASLEVSDSDLKDLQGIASLAARQIDQSTVKRIVIEQIRQCRAPLRAHHALARILPEEVLTTNYDDLYETACKELGVMPSRIVLDKQIPISSATAPRLFKLHGDINFPETIVLTGQDYSEWEDREAALITDVVGTLQSKRCLFIGYGLGDSNLVRLLDLVKARLGSNAPKNYVLTRCLCKGQLHQAKLQHLADFVEADATEFLELLAQRVEERRPSEPDLPSLEARFQNELRGAEYQAAVETCKQLTKLLVQQDRKNAAARWWKTLADTLATADKLSEAASASFQAGCLYISANQEFSAEDALRKGREDAEKAGLPSDVLTQFDILLNKAYHLLGDYHRVVASTQKLVDDLSPDATPALRYDLATRLAEAKAMLGHTDEAIGILCGVLDSIPQDRDPSRSNVRATLARMLADEFRWEEASEVLDRGVDELGDSSHDQSRALLDLVRANIHGLRGQDRTAYELYESCIKVFETTNQTLLVSALWGASITAMNAGIWPPGLDERFHDSAGKSREYQQLWTTQDEGIRHLAEKKLAQAHSKLLQALSMANAQYNISAARYIRRWLSEAYQSAGEVPAALQEVVRSGHTDQAGNIAARTGGDLPPLSGEGFDMLIRAASSGDLMAMRASLVALREAADFLPDQAMPNLVSLILSDIHTLPSKWIAPRQLRVEGARLARALADRLDDTQAVAGSRSLIRCIQDEHSFWTAREQACRALTQIIASRPTAIDNLDIPLNLLTELVDNDVLNDRFGAMELLVLLAKRGYRQAEGKALEVIGSGDSFWHFLWRYELGVTSKAEVKAAVSRILPNIVSRSKVDEAGHMNLAMGALQPGLLTGIELPKTLRAQVASELIRAVTDPMVMVHHRVDAALTLESKAKELPRKDRMAAIDRLLPLLEHGIEIEGIDGIASHPLSPVRLQMGDKRDITGAVLRALLSLSNLMNSKQCAALHGQVELHCAERDELVTVAIAYGLRFYGPKNNPQSAWPHTRLLLLLNSQYAVTRLLAAETVGILIENTVITLDAELRHTILYMARSSSVADRHGAALALTRAAGQISADPASDISAAIDSLREDASYRVRKCARGDG